MAKPQDMIDTLEAALAQNAGVVQVTVDGTTVRYDRKQLMEELRYWRNQLARQNGRRPIVGQIDLGGAW